MERILNLFKKGMELIPPMKVKIAIPGVMMDFKEAAVFAEKLSKAANIAKEFKYNGYFLDWND